MLMQKNCVKMHQRMDSKQEDFLNLRLNLSMTKFMLNPRQFPSFNPIQGQACPSPSDAIEETIGLVLDGEEVA